jgi:ppGpp synthetase/RelA/SpoT-type nucleotidyltranferase
MIVPSLVRHLYDETLPYVEALGQRVRDILTAYCRQKHYLYGDRIKALDSVAEKLETGRFKTWEQLDDLFAATVIVPLVTEEDAVLDFLRDRFETIDVKRRGTAKKPPDTFRFDSTRFIGRIRRGEGISFEPSPSIYSVSFEVQVESVFEFAWARTTHALAYKGPHVSWERQRLAAQLKAATEQLDMLVLAFDSISGFSASGNWPGIEDRAKIETFFRERVASGAIASELAPKDWTRFADNAYRVLQIFAGERPSGPGQRQMERLDELLDHVGREVTRLGPKGVPRSLSLLQFVVGVLGCSGLHCRKQEGFYFVRTHEMESLFPQVVIPGDIFGEDPQGTPQPVARDGL